MLDGLAIVIFMTLAPAGSGAATPKDRPDVAREETIIVTGERVSRSLRETASSVEVFSKDQIEKASGADRVEQVLALVPNVHISSGGEGPTIRGQDTTGPTRDLPAFLGGTRPRTTLVVDGRPVGFNEFIFGVASLWDVNRVEVFRSPQTTTQGQNSIAGAIFIETSDPSFVREYRARAVAGDFRTRQFSVAGTEPLTDDVAVRVAGDLRYSGTSVWMADLARGADPNHDVYGLLPPKRDISAEYPFSTQCGHQRSKSSLSRVVPVGGGLRSCHFPRDHEMVGHSSALRHLRQRQPPVCREGAKSWGTQPEVSNVKDWSNNTKFSGGRIADKWGRPGRLDPRVQHWSSSGQH